MNRTGTGSLSDSCLGCALLGKHIGLTKARGKTDALDIIDVSPYAQRKESGVELEGWGLLRSMVPEGHIEQGDSQVGLGIARAV